MHTCVVLFWYVIAWKLWNKRARKHITEWSGCEIARVHFWSKFLYLHFAFFIIIFTIYVWHDEALSRDPSVVARAQTAAKLFMSVSFFNRWTALKNLNLSVRLYRLVKVFSVKKCVLSKAYLFQMLLSYFVSFQTEFRCPLVVTSQQEVKFIFKFFLLTNKFTLTLHIFQESLFLSINQVNTTKCCVCVCTCVCVCVCVCVCTCVCTCVYVCDMLLVAEVTAASTTLLPV